MPRYERSTDVVVRRIGEETLLVPVRGDRADLESFFRLDGVGAFLWDRLDRPRTPAELGRSVAEVYAVDEATAAADAARFLGELSDARLVTES